MIWEGKLNKLFIIIGSFIVCLLLALLVAPLLINWSDHKAVFEKEASKLIGHPVKVKGAASARFLPIPTFTFANIEVGKNTSHPLMSANYLKLRLELIPLLQKKLEIIDMELQTPQISLRLNEKGQSNWHKQNHEISLEKADTVKLGPVKISNGAFYIADTKHNSSLKLENINAEVSAQSLTGPWKISGTTKRKNENYIFQFATGKYQNKTLRTKLKITPQKTNFESVFDGQISFNDSLATLAYKGKLTAKPTIKKEEKKKTDQWVLSGDFDLNRQGFILENALFEDKTQKSPLNLNGNLTLVFAPETSLKANITSRQIDFDRLYGKGATEPVSLLKVQNQLKNIVKDLPKPDFKSTFTISLPTIIASGDVIKGTSFKATPTRSGWQIDHLDARLPGQTRLLFAGLFKPEEETIEGVAKLKSEQPNGLIRWFHTKKDKQVPRLNAPYLSFETDLLAEKNAIQLSNLKTDFGSSDFSGTLSINQLSKRQKRYDAQLTSSILDLDTVESLAQLLSIQTKREKTTAKNFSQFHLKLTAQKLKSKDLTGKDATIDVTLNDETITISKLDITDFAGLKLDLSGTMKNSFSSPEGRLKGTIKARKKTGLIKFSKIISQNHPYISHLENHGSSFLPLDLAVDFSGIKQSENEKASNFAATLQGKIGKADLKTGFHFEGNFEKPYQGNIDFTLTSTHEKTADLLAQSGLLTIDVEQISPAKIDFRAKGIAENALTIETSATLQDVLFKSIGSLKLEQNNDANYRGTFEIETNDGEPLMRQLGFNLPESGFGTEIELAGIYEGNLKKGTLSNLDGLINGTDIEGNLQFERRKNWHWQGKLDAERLSLPWLSALITGAVTQSDSIENTSEKTENTPEELLTDNFEDLPLTSNFWSKATYGKPYLENFSTNLEITSAFLELTDLREIEKASFNLSLTPDNLSLSDIKGQFEKGALEGNLSLKNNDGLVNIDGLLTLEKAETNQLLWSDEERPLIEGHMTLSTRFNGEGRSLDAIISTLSGEGTVEFENTRLRRLNPQTFSLFLKAADTELSLDEETLSTQAKNYLDTGSLTVKKLEAPFTLSSGITRFANITLEEGLLNLRLSGSLNLPEMTLKSSVSLTTDTQKIDEKSVSGATPEIALLFEGPINQPKRRLDLKPLQSYLTVRRFEEEVKKVEALQADILEKQRLSRYLRWIESQKKIEIQTEEAERQKRLKQQEAKRKAQQRKAEQQRKQTLDRQNKDQIIRQPLPPLDLNQELLNLERETLSLSPSQTQ